MRPLTDLRAVLDAFAARQAAERVASGADKQPLLAAFWRLQQAAIGGDHRGMAAADRRLHETIVRLADVPGLEASWQAAADANEPFHRDTLARDGFAFVRTDSTRGFFPDWYQAAYQTPAQVRRTFSAFFDVAAHIPRGVNDHQDVVVLRRG